MNLRAGTECRALKLTHIARGAVTSSKSIAAEPEAKVIGIREEDILRAKLVEEAKSQDTLLKEETQKAYLIKKAPREQTLKTIKRLMRTKAYREAEKRLLEKGFKPTITKGTQCIATATKGTEGLAQMYTFRDSITGEFIASALTIPYADTGNRIGIVVACEDTEKIKSAPFYLTLEQPEDTTEALLIDEGEYAGYWIIYIESSEKGINWSAASCLASFIFAVAVPPSWIVTAGMIINCVLGFLGDNY